MWKFVGRKLGEAVVTLLVVSLMVFSAAHMTGKPEYFLAGQSPEVGTEVYAMIRHQYGLDRPFFVQYLDYLWGVVTRFDFGMSWVHQRPVSEMILERIPNTLKLAGAAMFLTFLIGVPLGVLAAVRRDSIYDKVSKLFATVGMAAPEFWVAIMLIMLFGAQLQWLPTYGMGSGVAGELHHLILPATVVAMHSIAAMMRLGRSNMLDVLDSEYIKFARIKGLRERLVIWKHATRNALIPLITFGGLTLATLLNGAIVIEVIFAWPGLGQLMLSAVTQRNYPLLQTTVLISAFFFIATSFLVDVLYAYADPRIRYG